jgi:DNA invertase Pin-like site-specific DNA recombinase
MSASATLTEVQAPAVRAVGLSRVSSVGDRSGSVVDQREAIERECERQGFALVDAFAEPNVSGGADLERRPGLRRAVEMVENGDADVVMVAFFDRLFRSLPVQLEVMERVERAGGKLHALDVGAVGTETASMELNGLMFGAFAQYYRRTAGERTERAKGRAVEQGRAPFPLPFYLRKAKDGTIEHNPKSVRALREAIRMRIAGATIAEARAHLRKRGVRVSYGGLQSAFRSTLLLGELRFGPHVNEHAFPPVITPEQFRRLQKVRVPRGRRSKSERLLARLGVLRCASCGSAMQVGTSKGTYALYKCPSLSDCEQRAAISAEKAEAEISEYVRGRLEGLRGSASLEDGLDAAERELEKVSAEIAATVEAFSGFDDVTAVREKMRALRERQDAAQERADHLRAASRPALTLEAHRDWDEISFEGRRDLIRAVLGRVDVSPGHRPDKLTIHPRQ